MNSQGLSTRLFRCSLIWVWILLTVQNHAYRFHPLRTQLKPVTSFRLRPFISARCRPLKQKSGPLVALHPSGAASLISNIPSMHIPTVAKRGYSFTDIKEAMALVKLKSKIDYDFWAISFPAFLGLLAEPLVNLFDGIFVGRLGAASQAGLGIASAAQYSVSKLYNDPLLKTSTSLVANKSGDDLLTSIATAIVMAAIIGVSQSLVYLSFAGPILSLMNVDKLSDMRTPALSYLIWKSLGVPAATVLIVCNGIFRGRGDTKTPLLYTTMGNILNFLLTPILMFGFNMGISAIGISNAVSQWVTVVPVLASLFRAFPFSVVDAIWKKNFLMSLAPYASAGGFIVLRTIAKVLALSVASAGAAKLGTVPMAAYSLSYSLMFIASQLCDALAISSQSLLARDMPIDSDDKRKKAKHIISRALQSGLVVSIALASVTGLAKNFLLKYMTKSLEVRRATNSVMPFVLLNQVLIGLTSTLAGLLMGGHDWLWTTYGMVVSALVSVSLAKVLPPTLPSTWITLSAFIGCQAICSAGRIFSGTGPWAALWENDHVEKTNNTLSLPL
jgi:putative MATE family efflux protein